MVFNSFFYCFRCEFLCGGAYYHGTCILGALLMRLACPCIWKVGQSNAGVRKVILVSLGNVVVRSSLYLNACGFPPIGFADGCRGGIN